MKKKLIFIELNEINFDVVSSYIKRGKKLPGFNKLISNGIITTNAEDEYKNIEPWIQWPSVHTGKTFKEHKVFRLGDFVNSSENQFFEKVEDAGFSVGAISPMNATNKMHNPAYFIPDPWTKTPCDRSFFSKSISNAISQSVNDNSQSKLTLKTIVNLVLAFVALVKPARFIPMFKFAIRSIGKPWRKALFLDMLLYEIHKTLHKRKNPNFSILFLNAGAHIQHHYFFNSIVIDSPELKNPPWYIKNTYDPIFEMLKVYDEMLLDLLRLSGTEIIIATGLSQKPFSHLKFYYRFKNHSLFLKEFGIKFANVTPRMTRDFLISFTSEEEALLAEQQLSNILVDNKVKLFAEIDNRGKEIFVVLTYPFEITSNTIVSDSKKTVSLQDLVTFVAIKNGEHQSKGFAYFSNGISSFAPPSGNHVSMIHNSVLDFFKIRVND